MKNFVKRLAVIAIAAVICFSMSACVINLPEDEEDRYAPDKPTGLYTTGATTTSISLDWDSSSGARGYYVYRSTSYNGTYSRVGSPSSSSYTDSGRSASTAYYYKVSAYNNAGESSQTDYVYGVTMSNATNYIRITGTPKVGSTLTATSYGGGWASTSYIWGYASSGDANRFNFISNAGSSDKYTITSGYAGDYIRAFRRHPNGGWEIISSGAPIYESNYIGPIQR
jgi:chitodextrinase